MLSNLIIVSGQVLTLFLLMGTGFVLRKKEKFTQTTQSQLGYLLMYVVTPCLIVDSLQIEQTGEILRETGLATIASCIFFAIGSIITPLMFRKKKADTRAVLRFGAMYPNLGFMGFPLVRAVLGESAMIYATAFLVVFQIYHWTHGVIIMSGSKNVSLKSAVFNPGVFGFCVGMLFFLFNIRLPWPIDNAVAFISSLNTPIAMIVIGSMMADAGILKLLRIPSLYLGSAIKLVLIPALTALAIYPLGLDPIVYCTIVILAATPCAGITSIFADRFGCDSLTAAQLVSLATLLSIITLPVFSALAKSIAGL